MISSDMEEVIGVSDRIAVMHEGRDQRHPRARGVLRAPGARSWRWATAIRDGDAEEGPRAPGPDPRGRRDRRDHQPALPLADQPRQHRQPRRPLRPLRHRPGVRDHHRRHRALGRLGDRAPRRALRRPDRQLRRALAAGGAADAGARRADRAGARAADHPARHAALHRHALRPPDLPRRRALLHRGRDRGLRASAQTFPDARMADHRAELRGAALLHRHARGRGGHVGGAAPLGLRPLPLRGRQERGGGALLRHRRPAG